MNHRMFLLTSLAFFWATPALAQTFSTPVPVSTDAGAHSPAMHVGRGGTICVSWFENNADIYFSHSTDGGNTFSAPVRVSRQVTTNNFTSLIERAPNFAIDMNGVIHLVWMEARIPNPKTGGEQSDIWYARSTDIPVGMSTPKSITIYDNRGSIVKRMASSPIVGALQLDVRALPSGAYVCEVPGNPPRRIRFVIP